MKKFWGQAVSGILSSKESDSYPPGIARQSCGGGLIAKFLLPVLNSFSSRTRPSAIFVALVLFCGLPSATVKAQATFASAQALPMNTSGSVTNSNTGVIADTNAPDIAGSVPHAPLWYSWTAPQSGEVEMDTIGSGATNVVSNANLSYTIQNITVTNLEFIVGSVTNYGNSTVTFQSMVPNFNLTVATNYYPLDTVLAVFTGNSIGGLSQVAANDNLFPINNSVTPSGGADLEQITESASSDYANLIPFGLGTQDIVPLYDYLQPYYGPSHLRFNAVAGTTYYIAVDTKVDSSYPLDADILAYPATGNVILQWAYQSSGVFRFATEDFDEYSGLPQYQAASTESVSPNGTANDLNSVVLTYYPYNAPGVLVTVTRVAGSSGRCTVNYSTEDGIDLAALGPLPANDLPGVANVDYTPVSGTLVFDDYEMSKTILVPIRGTVTRNGQSIQNNLANVYFGLVLTNAQLDPNEYGDVSQPRVDPTFGTAMVKILNQSADPYGPDLFNFVYTNTAVVLTNFVVNGNPTNAFVTNQMSITNMAVCQAPTNVLFGFEKSNYRVPEDVNSTWTQVAIYVERFGTNGAATTVNYRINNFEGNDGDPNEEQNIVFALQPGSDYAVPTPAIQSPIQGRNPDFNLVTGSLSFPSTGPGATLQKITFTVNNTNLTKFNKDFKIELYREAPLGNRTIPWLAGEVAETTVTVLFNDENPPAGSVDEFYNADFNSFMALPPTQVPATTPTRDAIPGVSGNVYSVAELTNGEALVAGDFVSYNGFLLNNGKPINNIVLVDKNGNLDPSFAPDSGADNAIKSVAVTSSGQYIIGGYFLSFNNQPQNYLARVNANGTLDKSFAPVLDQPVQSVVLQPDGKILIGGSFTKIGIQQIYGLARLNADGTLDTSFNPGTTLNGTVNTVAVMPGLVTNVVSSGTAQENDLFLNTDPNTPGLATVGYDFQGNNEMQVFYGGNLIFDTGVTTGHSQFSVPYSTGSTPLEFIVNPGSAQASTSWSYTATVATNSDVMAGGSFSVTGESYANIARFTTGGVLDNTFSNVFAGADNTVYALGWQTDGKVVLGGAFNHFNGVSANNLARLNWDGSLDTTGFFSGLGANDIIWNINIQPNGSMYVGGQFSSYNGTHRLGFMRLYSDGTVDTTFMDTAYNQFAGLKKIFADDVESVYASAIQGDSNIIIGGAFNQVGGGQAYTNVCDSLDEVLGVQNSFFDLNLWVEPKTREGVRDRYSLARLVGGSTPGPGNIEFQLSAYSANKSGSLLDVGLLRTNGELGPVSANFSVIPGLAQSGRDYFYDNTPPLYWVSSDFATHPSRERSDGLFGYSTTLEDPYGQFLTLADLPLNNQSAAEVSVINNNQTSGNLNAQFQLSNPSGANEFYLGGENIPLGTALGASSAPFTVVDNTSQSGTFGFPATNFIVSSSSATIPVIRSNGLFGIVTMRCFATNGTAVAGVDYRGVTNFSLQFGNNVTSNNFSVAILANGLVSTSFTGKTINLALTSLGGGNGNAQYGISNATLTLINPNFQGYLTLSATNYTGNENAGSMSFVVNRVAGSAGQISVQYATTNGTAVSGINYIGATNTLNWNNGDATPRVVTLPISDIFLVGGSEQFGVRLFSPVNAGGAAPSLFYNASSPGSITNATLVITNNDSYGTLQFSQPSYLVNANGGFTTVTVTRTGGATGKVSVNYNTSSGSNTTAGVDYTPTNGVLAFATNQIAASFNVFVTNTGVQYSSNYFFNVNLSNPTNAALGSPTTAQVNILSALYNQPPGSSNGLFSASLNGSVLALALQTNGQVLAGGGFTSVNGNPQDYIARLNTDGSLDDNFTASANGPVQALVYQTDGNVILGGSFSAVDGLSRNNIARVMTNGFLDTSFNPGPGANAAIYALAETFINGTREIYVGGSFNAISSGPGNNTGASAGVARLNNNGTLDTSFNIGSGADGTVFAIAVYPTNSIYAGDMIIGGSFVHFNGTTVNGLARLMSNGALDTNFNAGTAATNGTVNTITIQPDGRVLVGGSFNNFNGFATGNIIRLNADGSTDTAFVGNLGTGANNNVSEIVLQPDNRILVVGQFSGFNSVNRSGVTRLLSTGLTDPSINFGTGANGAVDAAAVQPGTGIITLGGAFTTYNGAPADHIIQIYGLSQTGSGVFEFSLGSYTVEETGIVAPITILRTGGTAGPHADGSGDVFVTFSAPTNLVVSTNGSAIAGVNYFPVLTNVDFPAGESAQTINVPILDDITGTTNQWTLTMSLFNPTTPATLLGTESQNTAQLIIQNVNNAISFSGSSYSVFENVVGGIANIDVIRQGDTNDIATVGFLTTTNGSTGIPGTDYVATNETITFNPGVSDVQAQVLIISNSVLSKTVGLLLTNQFDAPDTLIFSPSNANLTIENSVTPPGELFFASTNYTFNESGGSAIVTVLRTNGFSGNVTVNYTTLDGTAVAGINYKTNNGTLQINAGFASGNIVIPLLQNGPPEAPVTFSIGLSNPGNGATLIPSTNTTVTIIDDVNTGVAFFNATNTFIETNSTVTIPIERLGNTNSAFSVHYYTTNGTAVNNINYVTNAGILNFAAGQTLAGVPLTLLDNHDVTNLQFGMVLTGPSAGVQLGSPSNTVIVLQPSANGLSFVSPTNSVFKSAGSIVLPVVCYNPSNEPPIIDSNSIPLSVNYVTVNGTAQAGEDYTAVSGTLYFTNGIVTNMITVPILNNSLITGSRTFAVNLFGAVPVPPARLVSPSNEVVTIIDSNSGLAFSSANYSILNGGLAAITVVRVDNTNTVSSVAYATTGGGTAVPGADYYPTNGVLTFSNGQTSATFDVTVITTSAVQPNKTILLALSSPVNGVLTAPSAATLTIFNQNGSFVVPAGVSLFATNGAPGGILQSNQQVMLWFGFRDAGGTNIVDLHATLLAGNGVILPGSTNGTPTEDYGALNLNGASVAREFTLTPIGTNSQNILASFALQDIAGGSTNNIGTNTFTLTVGSWTTTFSNTNPITIGPGLVTGPTIASPYPSIITVSNVGGVLIGTGTTLTNFTHTSPQAVGALVVSPGQQDTLIMAGVGSQNIAANNVTLTFSDAATNSLPANTTSLTPITNGVYKPTQDSAIPNFP